MKTTHIYRMSTPFLMLCCLFTSQIVYSQSVGSYSQIELAYESGEYEKCIDEIKKHKKELTTSKDSISANVFFYLGDSYLVTGDDKLAVTNFEKELELREVLGDNEELSGTLYNLMYLYNDLGNYTEARNAGVRLLDIDKDTYGQTSEEYLMSVAAYMDVLRNQTAYRLLITHGENTLKKIDETIPEYGLILNKVADGYAALGNYSKAGPLFEQSLEIIGETKGYNSIDFASALSNVGVMYSDQGRYPDAEDVFGECIKILDERGSIDAIEQSMSILNNLALVYLELSNYEASLDAFQKIEKYDAEAYGKSHPYYANTLNNIGEAYNEKGSYEEALNYYNLAKPILLKTNGDKSVDYATNLNNRGRVRMLLGELDKAMPLYEQALEIYKKTSGKNSSAYATSLFNLGRALEMKKDPKAVKHFQEALKIRKNNLGESHPLYGKILPHLAVHHWAKGENDQSAEFFHQTFNNYFKQIDGYFSVLSEEEKTKFYYGGLRVDFEKFNAFAVANHHAMPQLTAEMYNYQLNTKALIMYATTKVRDDIMNKGGISLIAQYNEWLELKERLSKLYAINAVSDRLTIDSLSKVANTLEKKLTEKSSQFGEAHNSQHTWQEVRDQLSEGEAAVEVIRFRGYNPEAGGKFDGSIKYAVLIVKPTTKDYPELVMLENGKRIEERYIINYRNSIRYQIFDQHSYGVLWKPLAPVLKGVNKIYFSPDGVYNQISINSLYNPDTKQYLLEEMNIHNVTNTKDILTFDKGKKTQPGASMLFGYPDYNLEIEKEEKKGEQRSLRTLRGGGGSTGLTRGLRAGLLRYLRGDEGISMLPGTKTEVENIAGMFVSENAEHTTYYTKNADEYTLKQARNPQLLHIATHGFFMANIDEVSSTDKTKYIENPLMRSGLVLAGAGGFLKTGNTYNDEDGILTAHEAMNMRLDDTEVVVMSACETGLGTITNGEGVYGLQRAFLIAGAESLIMSMWNVDDDATQELMTAFYKEWLASGDKQESFRKAQYVVKEKYPEPFYWGAFIMVGE